MLESLEAYRPGIIALGGLGFFHLAQLLVADVTGVLRKHTPGTPVSGGHGDRLFRATRAHANTMESLGSVILITGFALAVGVAPGFFNPAVGAILTFRILHTVAYYLDLRTPRSICFAFGILALVALFIEALLRVWGG